MHSSVKQIKKDSSYLLVNGSKCKLFLDNQHISWWPINIDGHWESENSHLNDTIIKKENKKIKRVNFSHVIGIKKCLPDPNPTDQASANFYRDSKEVISAKEKKIFSSEKKASNKIKVFYAKQCQGKSSGRLIKLKKLSIEWPTKVSAQIVQAITVQQQQQQQDTDQYFYDNIRNSTKSTTKDEAQKKLQKEQDNSESPSCYSSEGYTSSLSHSAASSLGASARTSPIQNLEATTNHEQFSSVGKQHEKLTYEKLLEKLEHGLESKRKRRPKRLLIFVNPFGGKGKANQLYKQQVRPLLELAGVEVKLVVTKYANHARETLEDPSIYVEQFDGIICIGGDGMFSELMNGLLFRYNSDILLRAGLKQLRSGNSNSIEHMMTDRGDGVTARSEYGSTSSSTSSSSSSNHDQNTKNLQQQSVDESESENNKNQLRQMRAALGGIGQQFLSPPIPLGVIGAGSTDANSFGLIGTNDVITATLNIILGNQIKIDVCSIHSIREDRLLRFVSTFVAYGYFGDVIRESEKLRWLGPSRYDVTGANNLIKNRHYQGLVKILISSRDGSPVDSGRCGTDCRLCKTSESSIKLDENDFQFIEKHGPFVGVNAAVTACRCPQTKKGFSPNNHLANGCADLILVHPCSRVQYIQYLMRTGWTKKSAFDLKYVEAFRCRQFEFIAQPSEASLNSIGGSSSRTASSSSASSVEEKVSVMSSLDSKETGDIYSSWNADGEIMNELSVRVKVNNQLLRVFGTGEPQHS